MPTDAPAEIRDAVASFNRSDIAGALASLEQVPTDWMFPAIVMEAVAKLSPFWEEIAGNLKKESFSQSAGQYTVTPDSKPIIGPYPEVPGLYLNVGYSGHGVMGSPDGGRWRWYPGVF